MCSEASIGRAFQTYKKNFGGFRTLPVFLRHLRNYVSMTYHRMFLGSEGSLVRRPTSLAERTEHSSLCGSTGRTRVRLDAALFRVARCGSPDGGKALFLTASDGRG